MDTHAGSEFSWMVFLQQFSLPKSRVPSDLTTLAGGRRELSGSVEHGSDIITPGILCGDTLVFGEALWSNGIKITLHENSGMRIVLDCFTHEIFPLLILSFTYACAIDVSQNYVKNLQMHRSFWVSYWRPIMNEHEKSILIKVHVTIRSFIPKYPKSY